MRTRRPLAFAFLAAFACSAAAAAPQAAHGEAPAEEGVVIDALPANAHPGGDTSPTEQPSLHAAPQTPVDAPAANPLTARPARTPPPEIAAPAPKFTAAAATEPIAPAPKSGPGALAFIAAASLAALLGGAIVAARRNRPCVPRGRPPWRRGQASADQDIPPTAGTAGGDLT